MVRGAVRGWVLLILLFATARADAQSYPARPIALIVPFTPGSGIDIIARTLGQKLSERWGQPVVVDNKPGASGGLGAELVAKAPPNGYTVMVTAAAMAVLPALSKTPPYGPVRDFTAVAETTTGHLALTVNPKSLPVTSLKEFVAAAKARPGRLNYSSPGPGTLQHLGTELLKQKFGVDVIHIPYRGASGALTDLVAGQVDLAVLPVHTALPFTSTGQLRMLAVSTPERSPLAPDVPTFVELGYPHMVFELWYGVFGPPKLPPDVVATWERELAAVLAEPDIQGPWEKQGLQPHYAPSREFAPLVKREYARWREVGEKAGLTAD